MTEETKELQSPSATTELLDMLEGEDAERIAAELLEYQHIRRRQLNGDEDDPYHIPLEYLSLETPYGRLNSRMLMFVRSYLENPGETQKFHAKAAGYSNLKYESRRLMRDRRVQWAICRGAEYLSSKFAITNASLFGVLGNIIFADPHDFVDTTGGGMRLRDLAGVPKEKRQAIKSIKHTVAPNGTETTELVMHDKNDALKTAGRWKGLDTRVTVDDVEDVANALAAGRKRRIRAKEKEIEGEFEIVGKDDG